MMNPLRWMGGALGLLVVAGLGLWLGGWRPGQTGPTSAPTPYPASVAASAGAAYACAHFYGCTAPAAFGQLVYTDGEARTGPGGTADVQTRSAVFHLDTESTLHFEDVRDAVTQATLWLGRLFVSHDPQGHDLILIHARELTIQALDTRFSVVISDQGVYVAVPPDGGHVTVRLAAAFAEVSAGQEIQVPPNPVTLPAPQPISAEEVSRWNVVSCAWQGIVAVLTPGALPTAAGCGVPPALTDTPVPPPADTATSVPTDTSVPPTTDTPVPAPPSDTPVVGAFPISPPAPLPPTDTPLPSTDTPAPPVTITPPPVTDTPLPPFATGTPSGNTNSTGTPVPVPIDTATDTPNETQTVVPTEPPTATPTIVPTDTSTPTNVPTFTPTEAVVPPTMTPTSRPATAADYVGGWVRLGQGAGPEDLDITVVGGDKLHVKQEDWRTGTTPSGSPIRQQYTVTEGTGGEYQGDPYEVQYDDAQRHVYVYFWLTIEYPDDPYPYPRKRIIFKQEGYDPVYYTPSLLN